MSTYTITNNFAKRSSVLVLHRSDCSHLKRMSPHDVMGTGDTPEEAYRWAKTMMDEDAQDLSLWKHRVAACAKES